MQKEKKNIAKLIVRYKFVVSINNKAKFCNIYTVDVDYARIYYILGTNTTGYLFIDRYNLIMCREKKNSFEMKTHTSILYTRVTIILAIIIAICKNLK